MSDKLDLSKCKVGDKVILRSGKVVTISSISPNERYPIRCDDEYSRTFLGFWQRTEKVNDIDIVSIVKPSAKSKKTKPVELSDIKNLIGKIIVIDTTKNDGKFDLSSAELRGVFTSEKLALDYVRNDAKDTYDGDPSNDMQDLDNWGSDVLIVEVKRVVRPVPSVKVSCSVKTIAGGLK